MGNVVITRIMFLVTFSDLLSHHCEGSEKNSNQRFSTTHFRPAIEKSHVNLMHAATLIDHTLLQPNSMSICSTSVLQLKKQTHAENNQKTQESAEPQLTAATPSQLPLLLRCLFFHPWYCGKIGKWSGRLPKVLGLTHRRSRRRRR
jgi:hypothetical protein